MVLRTSFILVLAMSLPGCDIYFGGDDDDDGGECAYLPGGNDSPGMGGGSTAADPVPGQELRDPTSGQCGYFGGGGSGGGGPIVPGPECDDPCGDCPPSAEETEPTGVPQEPIPTWGGCYGVCESLAEGDCLATDGCRAAYLDGCPPNADCDGVIKGEFIECWATDQFPVDAVDDCNALDAYQCSQSDDCSPVHENTCSFFPGGAEENQASCYGNFMGCADEVSSCYGPLDCPGGYDCALPGTPSDGLIESPGVCVRADDRGPAGYCYREVNDDGPAPECPGGTLPGIDFLGGYTGYCIPLDACESPMNCSDIPAESTCIARVDCTPLYQGGGCSCTPDGCTCTEQTYHGCQ